MTLWRVKIISLWYLLGDIVSHTSGPYLEMLEFMLLIVRLRLTKLYIYANSFRFLTPKDFQVYVLFFT